MCPASTGHWAELWVRLVRRWQSGGNLRLGVPALLLLPLVLYWFPVLSALCGAAAVWCYHRSGRTLWRLPGRQLRGGAARLRQREAAARWASPPSSLLLMGSYLSTQEPPPGQGLARGRDYKERLLRPNPTVPTPARRLSFRETPGVANQGLLCPIRRYPLKQPQFSRPGSLPTVWFDECQNKLPVKRSRVTVKFPRSDTNFSHSSILENLLSPGSSSPPVECVPDPCAKETVLSAIKECMKQKRMNKEEYNTSGGPDNKRRRLESCGSAESSSEYHLSTGTLPSYASESGSLKRGLNSNILEDHMNKRPCTSSVSSRSNSPIYAIKRSTHNAITSSYSSIVSPNKRRKKRNLQNISADSSSPSSHCHCLSAKKSRESQETSKSSPLQSEKDHSEGCTAGEPPSYAANSSSEKGKRFPRGEKMLYLISKREPYKMPVPHDPGFYVTHEMYDAAQKKSFERLNELLGGKAAPAQTVNASLLNEKVSMSPGLTSLEPANSAISSLTTSFLPAPAITEVSNSAPPPQSDNPQPKSEPRQTNLLQILTKPLENDSQSGFKPIFPTVSPVTSSSGMMTMATAPTTDTFKPIFGDGSLSTQSSSAFKPIFGSSTPQQPTSTFTFQMGSTTSAATSLPGFGAVTTSAPVGAIIGPKPSLAPPISSISGTTNSLASLFPSAAAAATSTSGASSALSNSLLVSSTPAESQTKQFVFGQTTTSQATPGLNVFSSIQPASVSAPQQSAPSAAQQSSLFGFNTSAFTAPVSSNSSAPVANSGTSTSGSSNIQPMFGGFGTNSNPVTNLFASKPIASVGNSSAPSFGTVNATPTQSLHFGNSLAQNSVIQNTSTPLAFGAQGTSENEHSFASPFGTSSPAAPIPFSITSPASTASPFAQGNFKTGVTSKPLGARQRVLARRQRKK